MLHALSDYKACQPNASYICSVYAQGVQLYLSDQLMLELGRTDLARNTGPSVCIEYHIHMYKRMLFYSFQFDRNIRIISFLEGASEE